jgi:myosin heavy subunit
LLYKSKKCPDGIIYSALKKMDCHSNRDTLSKSIYNLIFQSIIDKIEVVLNPKNQEDSYELLTK